MAARSLLIRSNPWPQWWELVFPPWESQVRFGAARESHGGGGPSRSVVEEAVVEAQQSVAQALAFAAPRRHDSET